MFRQQFGHSNSLKELSRAGRRVNECETFCRQLSRNAFANEDMRSCLLNHHDDDSRNTDYQAASTTTDFTAAAPHTQFSIPKYWPGVTN